MRFYSAHGVSNDPFRVEQGAIFGVAFVCETAIFRVLKRMNAELCEEAGELIGNPNVLVNIVSNRVHQLNQGDRPLLDAPMLGAADMALSELVEGKMDYELTDPISSEIITAKSKGKKKK